MNTCCISVCILVMQHTIYRLCILLIVKVGPQVLVLGKEAQSNNGLATSLLLRVHSHYEHLSKEHDQTINHLTSQFLLTTFG